MENVSYFDLSLIVLLLIFGVKGLLNGLIKEVFGLIGIIGGVFLASRYADKAGDFINSNIYHINNKASIYLIGFLTILLLFWLLSLLTGYVFTKLVSLSGLGLINRISGFIIGAAKIFLLFSIVIFALRNINFFKNSIDSKLKNSKSYPYLIETGNYILKLDFNKTKNKIQTIIPLDKNKTLNQ